MNILTLELDKIDDSDRLRPVDPAYVNILAESIERNGQMTAIEVERKGDDGLHRLVAGAHRVAALRHLGKQYVEAVVFEGARAEADLREIDENLCRHDLNDLDRAIFLGKRKEVYERLHPQAKFGKAQRNQKVAKLATVLRFTLETAHNTKMAERTIRRLVARYENIDPKVREQLKGSWLASNGKALDAIAALSAPEQNKVVAAMLRTDNPPATVTAALIEARGIQQRPDDNAKKQFESLKAKFLKTAPDACLLFRKWLKTDDSRVGGR